MADITVNKFLFCTKQPLRRHIGNIAYYAFVAYFLWTASQFIGFIFSLPGVLEHFIWHQSHLHPEVLLSPVASILFGAIAFVIVGALVLALIGGICWYQRHRAH